MKRIHIGAAYYPEMWDEWEIDKDIERCKNLGINALRVGEFAWGKMEPREGEFRLEWLAHIVDKLHENGIDTVMCTPTATPPRWMLDKYPEMRRIMPDLIRSDVSSRCHVCKTSEKVREKSRLIVTEMAKVFANRPGVIGWQIDNEIFPYGDGCFCENCKKAFRIWLQKKYGTIEALNKAWGMVRWSLCYDSFDDIQPPYPAQWKHPSLSKAWWDFQCDQIKTFVDEQADILHAFGCKNVGTNMMQQNRLSYYDINEKLDVIQYNHYERAEDLPGTAFAFDFLRCVKDKPFWIMETQLGWNGSEYAEGGYRPSGNCYANTWLPISKGCEMNLYWLFRTHPNGHEIGHGALYSAAGRAHRETQEVQRAVNDFTKVEGFLTAGTIKSKIAMHYSSQATNAFRVAPLLKGLDYRQTLIEKFYAAFRHYNVDVIDLPHSLDGYKVVVSPLLAYIDEDLKKRMIRWVNDGGTWIVGPMSDIMDETVSKYTHAPYCFLEELAGVYTKYQKPVDNDVFRAKWSDGRTCAIGTCFDAYECNDGTQSLATYDSDEFGGLSVVTRRNVGKGSVILLGSVISKEDLRKLTDLPPIAEASENVVLTERENGAIIAVETEHKDGFILLKEEYTDLLSGEKQQGKVAVKPYQVFVLQK